MHPDDAKAGGNNLKLGWQILGHFGHIQPKRNLPTPTVSDQFTDGLASSQQSDGSLHSVSLAQIVHRTDLLPTPNTMEHREIKTPEQIAELKLRSPGGYKNLRETVINDLIPVSTNDEYQNNNWGQFQPAIERWENILGRKAPEPTEPTGKDGAPRLSAKFTEWMMGMPKGWITSPKIGIKRNEQLKACGNGVVPQQAVLALSILLEGVEL
jgi:DNA (cytosine-5)-methyltransferase 1